MLQAPPSRYKIVERDRRLVTIDTLTGAEVGNSPAAITGARVDTTTQRSSSSNMGGPVRGESAMGAARTGNRAAPSNANGTPSGPLVTLAGMYRGAQIEADGRVVLTTGTTYDVEGPRQLRLTAAKTNALGAYVIILVILFVLAVVFAIATEFFGLIILIFFGVRFGKPIHKAVMSHIIKDAEGS